MKTKQDLLEASHKHKVTEEWNLMQAEIDNQGRHTENAKAAMSVRRHPDTLIGFIEYDKADELLATIDGEMLLSNGLSVLSDGKRCFLTDDGGFGHGVLPSGWTACTFGLPLGMAHKTFDSVAEFLDHYYKDEHVVKKLDDLVDYLNLSLAELLHPA